MSLKKLEMIFCFFKEKMKTKMSRNLKSSMNMLQGAVLASI